MVDRHSFFTCDPARTPVSRRLRRLGSVVLTVLSVATGLSAFAANAATAAHTPSANAFARGHILVAPADGPTDDEFAQALTKRGGKSLGRLHGMNVHAVTVTPGSEEQVVAALRSDPKVA
jgi:hypothetical protein